MAEALSNQENMRKTVPDTFNSPRNWNRISTNLNCKLYDFELTSWHCKDTSWYCALELRHCKRAKRRISRCFNGVRQKNRFLGNMGDTNE